MSSELGIRRSFTWILPDHVGGTRAVSIAVDSTFKKTQIPDDMTPLIVKNLGEMLRLIQGHGG